MAIVLVKRYDNTETGVSISYKAADLSKASDSYEDVIKKIITDEKEHMEFPYDLDHYREEYDEHHWTAYSDEEERWETRYEFEEVDDPSVMFDIGEVLQELTGDFTVLAASRIFCDGSKECEGEEVEP